MNELVSIIIPAFNRENFISKTLDSISVQSYSNFECIIIDDGSLDRTIEIVNEFVIKDVRFKLFLRPISVTKGANGCRNYGFKKSKGSYINWFDSDDLMHEDFVLQKINEVKRDKELDLVLTKTMRFDDKENLLFETRTNLTNNLLEDYIVKKISWYLPDGMFKRSFLEGKELFTEGLKAGQDRNFYTKMLMFKPKISILDFYATSYRIHSESISEKLYRNKEKREFYLYNYSHFISIHQEIMNLNNYNLLTTNLKNYYFIEIKKKLPSVFYIKKNIFNFYQTLFKLSSFNFFYLKSWIKIVLASMSFLMFGKGEKLLK